MFLSTNRSFAILAAIVHLVALPSLEAVKRLEVDFEYVANKAQKLAQKKFKLPSKQTPEALKALNFDDYRKIRIVPEETFWMREGMPFQAQFGKSAH